MIARGKPGDKTTASLIVYRSAADADNDGSSTKATTTKDYVSGHRASLLLKNVQQTGRCFPQDLQIVQEMLDSADLTPVSTSLNPNQKHPYNLSSQHEIFECHWEQATQTLALYRCRNLLDRSKVHIASSTS